MTPSPDCQAPLAPHAEARLQRNLAALAQRDPELAARLCLPVRGDHVELGDDGGATYRVGEARLALELPLQRAGALVAGARGAPELLLFGLGLGELAREALDRPSVARAWAWERDPWLLRQALARTDYSAALAGGRLRLALGGDLRRLTRDARRATVVEHPFLARVYDAERRLLGDGPWHRLALLATGGLFVDALGAALEGLGFGVYRADLAGLAVGELEHTVRRLEPELLATVNYVDGLAEFCHRLDLDALCWEIDPATTAVAAPDVPTRRVHVFTYRRSHVEAYRRAGFEHVEYLPLAADPEERRPPALGPAERARYGAPLSFVGSSLVQQVDTYRGLFLRCWSAWSGESEERGARLLGEVLAAQREDGSRYLLPELLAERAPGFLESAPPVPGGHAPLALAAEIAACQKRLGYLAGLGPLGLRLWGDPGWKLAERHGARYAGPAGHRLELSRIYAASRVNLDVGRLYQNDIVPMRVFDALACGGFVLAEHTPDLEELFEIGVEVAAYRDEADLRARAAWYLEHPEEARAIARRGRAAVLERHAIRARVAHMLAALRRAPL